MLLLIGYEQDNTLFKLAGVKLLGDCGAPAYDERTMETNVPDLYVAGTAVGGTQDKYRSSSRTATCTWIGSSPR